MAIDRSEANRALAKVIAYRNCGKDLEASAWARRLMEITESGDMLAESNLPDWLVVAVRDGSS